MRHPAGPAGQRRPDRRRRARPDLVLRFAGTHWVAIDRSPNGIFVNGARMSTVDIRDGQAITIGDPQRGPRLIFNVGPSVGPAAGPAAGPTSRPGPAAAPAAASSPPRRSPISTLPTQRTTQRMRIPAPAPVAKVQPATCPAGRRRHRRHRRPRFVRPRRHPPTAAPATADPPHRRRAASAEDEQPKGRGLIERMMTPRESCAPRAPRPSPTKRTPPSVAAQARRAHGRSGRTSAGADRRRARAAHERVVHSARPGTLTAVIGPSAARNSALARPARRHQGARAPAESPWTATTCTPSPSRCAHASG